MCTKLAVNGLSCYYFATQRVVKRGQTGPNKTLIVIKP